MTKITVIIESTFSGRPGGFHGLTIDDSQPVKELISRFCHAKETVHEASYSLITKSNVVLINEKSISDFFIQNGEVLRLVTLHDDTKLQFRQWITMAGLGMFVGIGGLIVSIMLYAVFKNTVDNYAVVINAGTTQTDMLLYSWSGKKRNNTGEVTQVYNCNVMGGISNVAADGMRDYFEPCFKEMYKIMMDASLKNVEILFGATEGMRLLNQTEPHRVTEITAGVRKYLQQTKRKFQNSNVDILSGAKEGVSAWITSNYLKQALLEKDIMSVTYGALDLGDVSTQISFEVPIEFKRLPNVYSVNLFGNQHHVYSQSFLCYGVGEALRRYHTILRIEQSNDRAMNNIVSPCEPPSIKYKAPDSYFDSVCVGDASDLEESQQKKNWTIIGSGNYVDCQRVVSKLLNYSECISSKLGHCVDYSNNSSDVLPQNFLAFSAYSVIAADLGIRSGAPLPEVKRRIKVMCDYTLEERNYFQSKASDQQGHFELLCFKGQYMLTLITEVYGLWNDSTSSVEFTDQVNQTTIGWTMGYLINATQHIDAAAPIPRLKVVPFSLLTVAFVVFVLLSVGFIVHGVKLWHNSPGYKRLGSISSI